eukprot:1142496-Pelagomonas_calceolata.AAC.1
MWLASLAVLLQGCYLTLAQQGCWVLLMKVFAAIVHVLKRSICTAIKIKKGINCVVVRAFVQIRAAAAHILKHTLCTAMNNQTWQGLGVLAFMIVQILMAAAHIQRH